MISEAVTKLPGSAVQDNSGEKTAGANHSWSDSAVNILKNIKRVLSSPVTITIAGLSCAALAEATALAGAEGNSDESPADGSILNSVVMVVGKTLAGGAAGFVTGGLAGAGATWLGTNNKLAIIYSGLNSAAGGCAVGAVAGALR